MNNSMKTPLIRLAKREGMDKRTVWAIRVGSILLALLLGALVIAISGVNPFKAYGTIITGALGKKTAIRQTVKIAVPLLGCALAIAPCFKMRFWNIGAEGQITAGAIAASYFALYWVGKVPSAVLLLIMGAAGAVAGGIWALIPAFFKARWNTNENSVHPDDELHHHRCGPLAAGRPVGGSSRLSDHPHVRSVRLAAGGFWRPLRLDHCAGAGGGNAPLHELHQARLRDRRHR